MDGAEHGAFLHLTQAVIMTLGDLTRKVSLDRLSKLSRILAEHRRAASSSRGGHRQQKEPAKAAEAGTPTGSQPDGQLPPKFGNMVRQVYGASFAPDLIAQESAAAPPSAEGRTDAREDGGASDAPAVKEQNNGEAGL